MNYLSILLFVVAFVCLFYYGNIKITVKVEINEIKSTIIHSQTYYRTVIGYLCLANINIFIVNKQWKTTGFYFSCSCNFTTKGMDILKFLLK